jgi:hypothetical protein
MRTSFAANQSDGDLIRRDLPWTARAENAIAGSDMRIIQVEPIDASAPVIASVRCNTRGRCWYDDSRCNRI